METLMLVYYSRAIFLRKPVLHCYEYHILILASRSLCHHPSVCLCRLSVTFVRPTRAIEIFGNVSMPFGTLVIPDLSIISPNLVAFGLIT